MKVTQYHIASEDGKKRQIRNDKKLWTPVGKIKEGGICIESEISLLDGVNKPKLFQTNYVVNHMLNWSVLLFDLEEKKERFRLFVFFVSFL